MVDQLSALQALPMAWALKDQCLAAWNDNPPRAAQAAEALATLAARAQNQEIEALAAWTAGVAALAQGRHEQAIETLDEAAARFTQVGQTHAAASTQIGKLMALALLGRYAEAEACGLAARDQLLAHGDTASAGRIELNLGHSAWRQDSYEQAERYYRSAYARLQATGDVALLARAEVGLADMLALRQQFAAARSLYTLALERAEAADLAVIQAETECNLGNLALAQGRYAEALRFLERSRRRYAALEMPHESAYADLELAEAYLELNLLPEAAAIFRRVVPLFDELGMRFEQAWARALAGQTALLQDDHQGARAQLAVAAELFAAEGNTVNGALVDLFEAQLLYSEGRFAQTAERAERAERVLRTAGSRGRALLAAWLHGEALRMADNAEAARAVLERTLHSAEQGAVPQIAQRCATSLGRIAAAQGDLLAAEALLTRAVGVIEQLRAPLPAEEFRTAFLSDKLSPFAELLRICLATGRVAEALAYSEQARSRALIELLGGAAQQLDRPRDAFEAALFARVSELRQELNWHYQRISRALAAEAFDSAQVEALQAAAQEREAAILELMRQIRQHGGTDRVSGATFDLAGLQAALDAETAVVIYYSLDDELLAFLVTTEAVHAVRNLASERAIETLVERLRFQTDAMRRAVGRNPGHQAQLLHRAQHYLATLYDLLVRPLASLIGERRLAVVPHRALHYVPFRALFDGTHYLIEGREICTAPSAAVLHHCLRQPPSALERPLFVAVPDALAPRVRDEVQTIAPLWPDQTTLLDEEATLESLRHHTPEAGILHLACHGQFRADSPLFSSLRLADGWLTVQDAYSLELASGLVVLSACETGVSALAPGDELIGLARGFFAAGAPTLLVSLWTVDDATTASLMARFYERLRAGDGPARALRTAQRELMRDHPHPFFWAPFVVMGRW